MRTLIALAFFASMMLASNADAQSGAAPADAKDVASPEAIVQAMYSVISGPAGQARNWDRMRTLMAPYAHFVAAGVKADGTVTVRDLTPDDYVNHATPVLEKEGFFERGVAMRVTRYGHTAVVESPYESRHAPGEAPFARGINQFVLVNDGRRWWVTQIIWEGESAGNPLPPDAEAALKAR
ncbi:MAG TPA: hypothetical protein VGL66_07820 [Caulobacteraceae bacterium]|jgi:hypothetical protein